MVFNSWHFLVFFPLVTALYFLLPHRHRWALLLAASCAFYMAFIPAYILILFTTILIDYFAGIYIEESEGERRKFFLRISVVSTCLVLFVFKYFNFFNANFSAVAEFFGLNYPVGMLNIILPIGLSFHTFQSLSYVIEVYYGRQKAERNFGIYSLYVMFYPQLVAGPIERPQNLLHQFYEEHHFDYDRVANGLKLMTWGIFKKTVIADRLALFVNQVYGGPQAYEGVSLIMATVFFAFQIYCDFSGYSDIAIGSAQVMGFRLMDNFNRPYHSRSIAEFWKRWHISLSTWFRDYVYVPLGGSRTGRARHYANLLVTFMISGFWHGANWTYVAWGGLNGLYLLAELALAPAARRVAALTRLASLPRLQNLLRVGLTFALTCVAWVFFRAADIGDAFYVLTHLGTGIGEFLAGLVSAAPLRSKLAPLLVSLPLREFLTAVAAVVFLELVHLLQRHGSIRAMLSERHWALRWSVYVALVLAIFNFGVTEEINFIYFQF